MAQYIDKADLVAEIKKHQAIWDGIDGDYCKGESDAYSDMLSFIDTLEVKEVDIEKEIDDAEKRFGDIDEMGGYRILIFEDEFRDILRHFFELGLKVKRENQ